MAQQYVAPDINLGTWDLNSDACGGKDTAYMENLAAQALEIAGAKVNVFRMLGVHEQGLLQDLTGSGNPVSSGTTPDSLLADAFNTNDGSWKSVQVGQAVVQSFIGYNFGTKKNINGGERYAPGAPVRQEITTLRIKQGPNPQNRVLQARLERSDDGGITWKRADVFNLPNTGNLETIALKQSAASQIWRIVPIMFAGGPSDSWEVVQIQLMNYTQTNLSNIQDMIFLENRDRDYADISIQLRAHYDLIDVQTELTKFGIDLPQQYIFTVSFARMIEMLGRPVVIGDILELPNEVQYDHNLVGVRKWLEVIDCGWSTEGYTPGWKPIMYRFTATPAIASQETMDLFKSDKGYEAMIDGDFSVLDSPLNMLAQQTTESVLKKALDDVPETGADTSDIQSGMNLFNEKGSYDGRDYSVEDGMPPNNAPFTEGPAFPPTPNDGDYHRTTYDVSTRMPTKLFQWNHIKNRWIFLETDRRMLQSSHRPSILKKLESTTRLNITDKA
jgi:hypothetical protein